VKTSEAPGYREVAPVRPGEDLDWRALEIYLRSAVPELHGDVTVEQFPNGSANLTYRIAFGDRYLVVRRPPFGHLAPGAHDMRREYRALRGLGPVYDRAPRALAFSDDVTIIGAPFLVTEYRPGVVVTGPDTVPPTMSSQPEYGRRMGLALVDALVDLHQVDVTRPDLAGLGNPVGFLERQLRGWAARWEAVADAGPPHPLMTVLTERLAERVPESPAPAVLHNDFKLDNCQFGPDDPDRVVSVFDWDMATLGDPLADLGALVNYLPDPDGDPDGLRAAIPGLESMGLPSREQVVERYALGSGTPVDAIAWYEAYATWKTAVIMQQLYARYVRGETRDERMRQRADPIDGVAARALERLEEWRHHG
jgi:aminoglycoside phosphotransferase (APT) family kinase protein